MTIWNIMDTYMSAELLLKHWAPQIPQNLDKNVLFGRWNLCFSIQINANAQQLFKPKFSIRRGDI